MKNFFICLVLMAAFVEALYAQRSARGSLRVAAQIEGSLSILFSADSVQHSVTARGSGLASLTIPAYGGSFSPRSMPAAVGDASFLISTPFTICVIKANLMSTSYALKAKLGMPDASHAWLIDGVDISSGNQQTIDLSEFYGVDIPHRMVVSGPPWRPGQPLINGINFQVTAN